jgi:transposase-like protein
LNNAYRLEAKPDSKKAVRKGVWKCGGCREQFTVTVGTIFTDPHIPLNKWLMAIHLLCSSKKGMSAHKIHRMLGVTYKSAWFMMHRIRYAMTQEPLSSKLTGVIEVDKPTLAGSCAREHSAGTGVQIAPPELRIKPPWFPYCSVMAVYSPAMFKR